MPSYKDERINEQGVSIDLVVPDLPGMVTNLVSTDWLASTWHSGLRKE